MHREVSVEVLRPGVIEAGQLEQCAPLRRPGRHGRCFKTCRDGSEDPGYRLAGFKGFL